MKRGPKIKFVVISEEDTTAYVRGDLSLLMLKKKFRASVRVIKRSLLRQGCIVQPKRHVCGKHSAQVNREWYKKRKQDILEMHGKGMTYAEIGRQFAITKQRVEQIVNHKESN